MDSSAFLPASAGLPPGFSRETTIHRDASGRWSQDGVLLEHANLVRAFDRWIDRADDGRLCLKNDLGWAYVSIDGAPLFVRSIAHDADGVRLRLSDDREEPLDVRTLRLGKDGALYCDARAGQLAARFDRHAQLQLGELFREDARGVYLTQSPIRSGAPTNDDVAPEDDDGPRIYPQAVDDPIPWSARPQNGTGVPPSTAA
jgi:uncharacterized protein